jgi:aminoglycoside phosphotransferase (APT) family kinase protein
MDAASTVDWELVAAIVAEQFPQWSHLPIVRVVPGGWENRTFRLGDE